jgi:hypothetical protein
MRTAAQAALIAVALAGVGWTAPAELPGAFSVERVQMRGFRGPDVRQLYICRVLPQYGGGFCTSPPYAPVGKRCSCEGPNGPRWGVVEHR